MLVFLSDLHLSDETAGPPNVPGRVFKRTLLEIADMAEDARAESVNIVLLGDIFELIRSAEWLNVDQEHRPWGEAAVGWPYDNAGDLRFPKSEEAAYEMLQRVLSRNELALQCLKSDLISSSGKVFHSEVTFIPGNHDRLVNVYPRLRAEALEAVGSSQDPEKELPQYFASQDHATFARHGHEWDSFNFEAADKLKGAQLTQLPWREYLAAPIGDVLAGEFASFLPAYALEHLDRISGEHPMRGLLAERLKDLFDVRPSYAMFAFLAYQIESFEDQAIQESISAAINRAAGNVRRLPFFRQWVRKHDGFSPIDTADQLEFGMKLLERENFWKLRPIIEFALRGGTSTGTPSDNLMSAARRDFKKLDRLRPGHYQYVLYGHTHIPDTKPVAVLGSCLNEIPRMYINTGRWRPMHNMAPEGGFVSLKELSYTVVYHRSERPSQTAGGPGHATMESWNGVLKDD